MSALHAAEQGQGPDATQHGRRFVHSAGRQQQGRRRTSDHLSIPPNSDEITYESAFLWFLTASRILNIFYHLDFCVSLSELNLAQLGSRWAAPFNLARLVFAKVK